MALFAQVVCVLMTVSVVLGQDQSFPVCGQGQKPKSPFCVDGSYDKLLPPRPNNTVWVNLLIHDVEGVSDSDSFVIMHLEVTLQWLDERLKPNDNRTEADRRSSEKEGDLLGQDMVHSLWIPDFAIYNLREFSFAHIIKRLAVLRIFANSTVHYSFKVRVTVGCSFYFENYPMDAQECLFLVGSYSHTSEEMIYDGKFFHPLEVQRPLPVMVTLHRLNEKERTVEAKDKTGKVVALYSVTGLKLKTKRGIIGKIFVVYFPSSLAVFASWISFTIDQSAIAGRLGLLVFLTLWQVNIFAPLPKQVPPSRYMTAIELYCMVCLLLNACALLEYGLIICQKSEIESFSKGTKAIMSKVGGGKEPPSEADEDEGNSSRDERWREKKRWKRRQQKEEAGKMEKSMHKSRQWWDRCRKPLTTEYIDHCSIFLFPTIFIIFNFVYWNHYLPEHKEK